MIKKALPATPAASIGQSVSYVDHHDRLQTGVVRRIEAMWQDWNREEPLIIYQVSHPTYRNNVHYTARVHT